jgi:hypothetical protein
VNSSRERDQAIERLLRQSRPSPPAPQNGGVADSCLDAETMAAWADGGLSGPALAMAETHVADCARCQSLVGTLARINSAVPPAEPEPAARGWLAWLVPLSAAAVAVAVWIAVPHNTLDKDVRLPQTTEVEPAAPANQPQVPASGSDADRPLRTTVVPESAAKKEVAGGRQLEAQMRRNATPSETDNLSKQQTASDAIAPSASAAPLPAAPAAAAAPAPPSANALDSARPAERRAETAGLEIVSPDPMVRWRIAGSIVQRSTNGGATWEPTSTGISTELMAGAAPSALVCWVVGRSGVVLVSADGRSWRRVAFPEMTDLSGVRARDARAASVSTADGRTFSTTDAGATWVPRPLQDF